jgi:DNA polymerase III epsilon subunit-like protein
LHTNWFCNTLVNVDPSSCLLCFIDLETTGLSLRQDEICEIAVMAADTGAVFSTVVRPTVSPVELGVHGISTTELLHAPIFPIVFARVSCFLEDLRGSALSDDSDSSSWESDEPELPHLKSVAPTILLAAHNGFKFDFPMLLSSCWRQNVTFTYLASWLFVDTLVVLRAVSTDVAIASCFKLQCQRAAMGLAQDLRAHRALDDVEVLSAVIRQIATSLGTSSVGLLARFACKLDVELTIAEMAAALDVTR